MVFRFLVHFVWNVQERTYSSKLILQLEVLNIPVVCIQGLEEWEIKLQCPFSKHRCGHWRNQIGHARLMRDWQDCWQLDGVQMVDTSCLLLTFRCEFGLYHTESMFTLTVIKGTLSYSVILAKFRPTTKLGKI